MMVKKIDDRSKIFLDSTRFVKKCEALYNRVQIGDLVIWKYGNGESMNANYTKLKNPVYAVIEDIYPSGVLTYITGRRRGEKIHQFFTYKDLIIGDLATYIG